MDLDQDTSRGLAFREGVKALKEAKVDSPALDAAILLGHATGECSSTALIEKDASLGSPQASRFRTYIQRRCRREAVSRIVGSREFYSRLFTITGDVLDPRPETELLVGEAVAWLGTLAGPVLVADIGTGSGAIAVTVAAEVPAGRVVATDISRPALAVAATNAAAHDVDDRVSFIQTDLGSGIAGASTFDLLLSNPPYIAEGELADLAVEVREGDPRLALVAGPEGTEFYPALASLAARLLRPGGRIMVEIGEGQAAKVASIFQEAGFMGVDIVRDLGGVKRVVGGAISHA